MTTTPQELTGILATVSTDLKNATTKLRAANAALIEALGDIDAATATLDRDHATRAAAETHHLSHLPELVALTRETCRTARTEHQITLHPAARRLAALATATNETLTDLIATLTTTAD